MDSTDRPKTNDLELRISRKHILELSNGNVIEENDEARILLVNNCKNVIDEILDFNFEKFPKIFVIVIKFSKENFGTSDELLEVIVDKFSGNIRPLLVELSAESITDFYYKQKDEEKFVKLPHCQAVPEVILKRNIAKFGLKTNYLLQVIKTSILDVDLSEKFANLKDIPPVIQVVDRSYELSFRLLDLFDMKLSEQLKDEILLHTIKFKKFSMLLAFFNAFNETEIISEHIDKILNLKCGEKLQNVFIFAIEFKNSNLTKLLLQFSTQFPKFFTFQLFEEAVNTIKKMEFYEVFDSLKISKFKFTSEEKKEKQALVRECEKILSEISLLKKSIEGQKIDKIVEFAEKYPDFRLCCGKSETSALELSIDTKNFNIYALLRSLGFYTDKGDEFDQKIQALTNEEKEILRDENLKHFVSNPEACIGIILSKCTFEPQSPIASSDVREMLLDLNRFDEISSIFPIVAHADVKINFDFKNKYIHNMDPVYGCSVLGLAYHEKGILYIALNNSKSQRYGTFAHELMHLVYFLIYENECLPYCKGDTEREVKWKKIVKDLNEMKNSKTEKIIEMVFDYNKSEWLTEMAVRVNDMIAFYHDNPDKILELEKLYVEFFSYMRDNVIADFKIPNIYRMIKLNNDFGLLQNIEDSKLQVKQTEKQEMLNLVTERNKKILLITNVPQLILSKVCKEIKGLPGNRLNLKARNLFFNQEIFLQKHCFLELMSLIKKTKTDRIMIKVQDITEENLKVIYELESQVFFIVTADQSISDLFNKYLVKLFTFKIQWHDLAEETQTFLLNKPIKFQENYVILSQLLLENSISAEIITVLCSDGEIKVNCESKKNILQNFIERKVQIKMKDKSQKKDNNLKTTINFIHEDSSLESFLTITQDVQILVISDVAGSGKTTLLVKIHEILARKFPNHFIIFISLIKYVKELRVFNKETAGLNGHKFIAKILNFDALEEEILMQKYLKGEVKILFDAFDEISPKCKENTTKLFQLFKEYGKNQIFITTRTHLEHDLENDLQVLAHRLKTLTEDEQVKFLIHFWVNSNRDLVIKIAKLLVAKITEIFSTKTNLIGVPLIVQGLAEAYKNKLDENFEHEIQNLDISSIYEIIVETFFEIYCLRFPLQIQGAFFKTSPLQIHQFLAICLIFDEEFANLLGLTHDDDEWPLEEIARCGLVKYDKDEKFYFNHQTYAEFLIALFFFHLLKTVKKFSPIQLELIFQVLADKKFQITRMFLNSMLNQVEKVQDLKSFNSSYEICQKAKYDKDFLKFCVLEKLFNIFEFFGLILKKGDIGLFEYIIEQKSGPEKATNLMQILPYASNRSNFENFIDNVLFFYHRNILAGFLLKYDRGCDTILHYFAANCKNTKVFECFWDKIKGIVNNEEMLKNFLLLKENWMKKGLIVPISNENGQNSLLWSIVWKNEISFCYLFEHIYSELFDIKDFAFETTKYGENILHYLSGYGSVLMIKFAFKKLKNGLSYEDFQNFIRVRCKIGRNLLHYTALYNENEESVEILVSLIKNEVGCDGLNEMLMEFDTSYQSMPLQHAAHQSNLKVLKKFYSLYEKNFNTMQVIQILHEKNFTNKNFLHCAAQNSKFHEVFEFAWMKIKNLIKDKDELKKYLLVKGGKLEKNILLQSIKHRDKFLFIFLFEKVFCNFFSIKEFANESDKNGENILHYLVRRGSVSMLRVLLEKLRKEFSQENFQNFIKLTNVYGQNIMHLAFDETIDEKFVDFLVVSIEIDEIKKMLIEFDSFHDLPLHCAVTLKNFEFFFSLYDKILTFNELQTLMTSQSNHKNVFAKMCENNRKFPDNSKWQKTFQEYCNLQFVNKT